MNDAVEYAADPTNLAAEPGRRAGRFGHQLGSGFAVLQLKSRLLKQLIAAGSPTDRLMLEAASWALPGNHRHDAARRTSGLR